jgi:hypothetical protein
MNKRLHPQAVLAFAIVIVLALAGCQSVDLEQSIGVGPDDNAILRVEAHVDPAWTESTADYCRTEFPAGFDISTLTPEQLEAATGC